MSEGVRHRLEQICRLTTEPATAKLAQDALRALADQPSDTRPLSEACATLSHGFCDGTVVGRTVPCSCGCHGSGKKPAEEEERPECACLPLPEPYSENCPVHGDDALCTCGHAVDRHEESCGRDRCLDCSCIDLEYAATQPPPDPNDLKGEQQQ